MYGYAPINIAVPIVVAPIAFVAAGCAPCDSEIPCEQSNYAWNPRGVVQGIAGVAYSASDVVENGCRDCRYESYSFEFWQFDTDPRDPDVITSTLADDVPPDGRLTVNETYGYELDPDFYLICTTTAPRSCAVLDIGEREVWTVHLRGGFVVPSPNLKIFRPDGEQAQDLVFLFPEDS